MCNMSVICIYNLCNMYVICVCDECVMYVLCMYLTSNPGMFT